jgi:hypothetical protein
MIVIYDAAGVRREAGFHAEVLNKLIDDWFALTKTPRRIKRNSRKCSVIPRSKSSAVFLPVSSPPSSSGLSGLSKECEPLNRYS